MKNIEIIRQAAEETFKSFDDSALGICSGFCGEFAAILSAVLTENNIAHSILYTKGFAFLYDLENCKCNISETDFESGVSHCYIEAEGLFFDAFDLQGSAYEEDMKYQFETYDY